MSLRAASPSRQRLCNPTTKVKYPCQIKQPKTTFTISCGFRRHEHDHFFLLSEHQRQRPLPTGLLPGVQLVVLLPTRWASDLHCFCSATRQRGRGSLIIFSPDLSFCGVQALWQSNSRRADSRILRSRTRALRWPRLDSSARPWKAAIAPFWLAKEPVHYRVRPLTFQYFTLAALQVCNRPVCFQGSQSRATMALTGRGSRHPSGHSTPRQASPLLSHTRHWRPVPRIPQSNTAPVWPNGKTPIHRGRTGRATSRRCQHIQVRFWVTILVIELCFYFL